MCSIDRELHAIAFSTTRPVLATTHFSGPGDTLGLEGPIKGCVRTPEEITTAQIFKNGRDFAYYEIRADHTFLIRPRTVFF